MCLWVWNHHQATESSCSLEFTAAMNNGFYIADVIVLAGVYAETSGQSGAGAEGPEKDPTNPR